MIQLLKKFITIINTVYIRLVAFGDFEDSAFYLTKFNSNKENQINAKHSSFSETTVTLIGKNNRIECDNAMIDNSLITIKGTNNTLELCKGVKLRKATIVLRGCNCTISIGENTTFGQIRIVNVGKNNTITIGKNSLFADHIEIWASDTHSIYDGSGQFINPEKPISIGDNVWIGSYVKILKGINIGDGAIVGMNTLLAKDVEAKTLVAGNPVKTIRENVTWNLKYENE
ncbi:MAG: acyltransferase [Bacteroidales bacterium]|nr:acyltransferase [Bacteroidales bacterium]